MLDLSKVWPEWKAVEKVGEGSFGKVYKCEREEYGISSVSAIKVISIPQSKAELESMSFEGVTEEGARTYFSEIVNDFANEIKLMEMLKGAPNVVAVENYKIVERADEIGWDIYIRMEYLQSFVAYSKNKKFTEAEVKKFALDISNALDICSKNGVIHRDVKPDNIFVDKFGSFKLGDFGVARRLEGSMSMMSKKGTYSYMAPEVFRGEKYDHRADIYSLGMVMYKLLNRNRDPFIDPEKPVVSFKERNESLERRRRGERLPAPIDASPEMASVILRACEFRPEDRYLTVDDFRNAILSVGARIINDEPTTKLFEDKTIVVAPRVFEFDETEPAVMTANPSVHSSDEPTVFADDEPTAFAQDVTCMADEPTVFAQDVTVFDDGKEPTVMADDATVPDEPTMLDEPTLVDPDLTVAEKKTESNLSDTVDKVKTSQRSNEDEEVVYINRNKKDLVIVSFLVLGLVIAVALIIVGVKGLVSEKAKSTAKETENNFSDTVEELTPEEYYNEAQEALAFGDVVNAAILFGKAGDYSDARERSFALWDDIAVRETIAAGDFHTIALKSDGTFWVTEGGNSCPGLCEGNCVVNAFEDIVTISQGSSNTVGLKSDGTVVSTEVLGMANDYFDYMSVDEWTDIVAISVSGSHIVGLKSDGTVVSTKIKEWMIDSWVDKGQCNVEGWTDIVAISATSDHTFGVKSDGTVVVTEYIENLENVDYYVDYGQCDVDYWTDIVSVSAGYKHTVGLKSDGTVIATGDNEYGQCNVESWADIVAVSVGKDYTVGLKSDGTVVAVGNNSEGQCDVEDWTDIVAVSVGHLYTVGLKSDGTVVAVGDNSYGQCDVDTWTNIKLPDE